MAHLSHFYLQKYIINYILVIVGENMKKVLIFLLTFFIGFALINADEVSDVACLYDLGTYGKVEIQINNYNTNNPSVSIKCQDKDTYQYKNYNSKKVYNNCKGESTTMPYDFFSYSKDEHSLFQNIKRIIHALSYMLIHMRSQMGMINMYILKLLSLKRI